MTRNSQAAGEVRLMAPGTKDAVAGKKT